MKIFKKRLPMHGQIFVALLAAILLALTVRYAGTGASAAVARFTYFCDFIAKLFLNALKMIVVPLTLSSIVCGVMRLGSGRDFSRMGAKTVLFYLFSSLLAIIVGLLCVNLMRPGAIDPETARNILGQCTLPSSITLAQQHADWAQFLLKIIPSNIVAAATDNSHLLGIIFFGLLYGFCINQLSGEIQTTQRNLWRGVQQIMLTITGLIIRFAPLGVFGLVFPVLLRTGSDLLRPLLVFMSTVFAGLLFYLLVVSYLLLRFLGKINPWQHYKAMFPVMLTAFSTSSSATTLPVAMEAVEREAGVSNKITSFTLPIGATLNMSGTAMYECVVVLFIAQLCGAANGIVFTLGDQLLVVALCLLTSMGVVGIPAAALVSVTMILSAFGLPLEAVGMIWAVERILDMSRTVVNVFSDTCGAVVIARSEGEKTKYVEISEKI